MRRFLHLLLPIFAIACSGQEPGKQQQAVIDTAKLFNPHAQPGEEGSAEEATNMFTRSIVLFKPGYYFMLKKQEHKLEKEKDVKRFIGENKKEMKKSKVYIMTDSNTAFSKILSTINLLKEQQVTDYKVINIDQYFAPKQPHEITTPKSVTTTITPGSDDFAISLQKNKITVKLSGKSQELKDFAALDHFITANKSSIDTKKILVVGDKETKSEFFKSLTEVLTKHKYFKFSMVSQ